MKLLSREVFREHDNGRPVVNGFVSYISNDAPVLMLRTGYEDYSDAYDDFSDSISYDNGRTWGDPELKLRSYDVEGGKVRYAEPAALFDPHTGRLTVIVDRTLHPNDTLDVGTITEVVLDTYNPVTEKWAGLQLLDLSPGRCLQVSFPFPMKTSKGRLLFPAMRPLLDEKGKPVHYPGCWSPAYEPLMIMGDYQADGNTKWQVGRPASVDPEKNCRGLSENTIAELGDGRLAMICRGCNSMFAERPGYKWLSFSEDDGLTWSEPMPLPCDKGDPIESSATGSALFRSIKTGKLYWLGNLCIHGQRPNGNYPRTPLVVAEVQEAPFALKRDTITVIGQRAPNEPQEVQMSNFRFYQDRESGDLVVFVTRYAEHSAKDWKRANYYRYRVQID